MDAVKAQLEKIRQQLAGLTATQRMLVATLVAIMVLTILFWGRYAGNPDMVPVLDQSLSGEEMTRIDAVLSRENIPHTTSGDKVLVPADRKMEIVADLMYQNMLPSDIHSAFDETSKSLNPLGSQSDHDAAYNHAKEITLSQIITRFPHVAEAQVLINAKNEQRVEGSIMPSATIVIRTRDSVGSPKALVIAAADSVAHAVAGLTRGHIGVIVDGKSMPLTDAENDTLAEGSELMDMRVHLEAVEAQRIMAQFEYIPNLMVSVSAQVENRTMTEQKHTYDAEHTLVKANDETSKSMETSSPLPPAGDPGVGANTGASIVASAAGAAQTSTTTEENTKSMVLPSDSILNTQTPAGKDTIQSAVVRVPRSYFVSVYKIQNKGKDPDDTALSTLATAQMASIRDGVKKCVGIKSDDDVSVDMYPDLPGSTELAMATSASPASSSLATVTTYGKQIAVGVLAVVSLFMMAGMVRKSGPVPIIIPPVVKTEPSIFEAREGLAGEVNSDTTALSGIELDDEAVRTQQMIEQVSTMVKDNPDGAASLVKRWLNRT